MWKAVAAVVLLGALALMLMRSERPEAMTGGRSDQGERRSEFHDAPAPKPDPDVEEAVRVEIRDPASFAVDDSHDSSMKPSTTAPQQAAVLSGWIRDRSGARGPLRVCLSANERPGWLRHVKAELPPWVGEVRPDGWFRIEDLPAHFPLAVTIRAGREQLLRRSSALILRPGEHREVEWQVGAGGILSGVAVNGVDGHPESDLEIWLAPAESSYFYFEPRERDVRKTRSDWEGRFTFHALDPGEWAVGPAPEDPTGRTRSRDDAVAPAVTRVEILDETSDVEVVVRVHRGHYISGRVIDPEGQPAPGEHVEAHAPGGGGYLSCESGEEGLFRLGPLVPATFSLVAGRMFSRFAKSDSVEAWSGQTDVILRLKTAASISGMVIDALTGRPAPGWIYLQGVGPLDYRSMNTKGDGTFALTGVEPGLHHLIAKSEAGRIGFLKDIVVKSGESVEDLELFVRAGGTVRVGYKGPLEWGELKAISDGLTIQWDGIRNGTEETFVAPAGPLEVQLIGYDRKSGTLPPPILFERSRDVHVRFGETMTVTFEIEE